MPEGHWNFYTDDLLRRARRLDTCIFPNERSKCLCGELADRIEKLEAALREIATPDWIYDAPGLRDMARNALEEES
jgi:hypothetical protein